MAWSSKTGLRRHLSLLVSGGLVLLIGLLGVVAGHAAGQQAREVHRTDRLGLQKTLAGLVEQYVLLSAAEVVDTLAEGDAAWSTTPGDPRTVRRLQDLVGSTRALDAGAVLVSPLGQPLASWSPVGTELPAADDGGWAPLRASVLSGKGTLPLSGVLNGSGDRPLLAMGLPVPLADGRRGLVLGLWDARASALQQYVSELTYGETGHGYVVDATGRAIAGPQVAAVGEQLPGQLREAVERGESGIVETGEGDAALLSSYARAGATGWTALTPQDLGEFEGGLVRSGRLVEVAVVALLLIAGASLVVLHRKREVALEDVALHDDLTGLYNRRGWFVLAEHELERARRQGSARVLLFVDLDGLKQVNDALGHREGDRAIADAAAVLSAASRSSDLVGRLGGDEFVLLLGEDGQADVARRRLIDALQVHNAGSGASFELRLSIGAEVWFPDQACTLDELVRRADAEMYVDKTSRPHRHEGLLRVPEQRAAADVSAGR